MREMPYSHKPRPKFFGNGKAFLGLELEVVASSSEAKRQGLMEAGEPQWAYAKHDGSLPHEGWELVTHPISMNFWMTRESVRDYHDVAPGTTLTARYKGQTYTATMRQGGRVEWNGTIYNSISAAGKAIRGGKSTNGYAFFGLVGEGQQNPVGSFFRLVAKLREMGYTSHENGRCGFHVHVSRTAFSDTGALDNPTFFRFKCLVNGALFRKLSQRATFNFCQQEPVTRENFTTRGYGRYHAVNITAKTAEVRIFRGNLREERLRKNLEAVIAAIEFAQDSQNPYVPPTDEEFTTYVRQHADRFPNLVAYLDRIRADEVGAIRPIQEDA